MESMLQSKYTMSKNKKQRYNKNVSDKKTKIVAVIIISVAIVLAITSIWDDSLIVDEIPHIGAGYSYLIKQDLRLNPEHPPLVKDLAAFPLLLLKLKQTAFETKQWLTDVNGQWEFGKNLIYNSGNDTEKITRLAKFPMLLFFVLAAILIFKWAKKLYGNGGALVALLLFSFSPTVLAHARFVTTDLPALFGVLFATYFFVKYSQHPNRKNFWLASIAFGIALLTKFSTFLLVPYFIILAFVWGFINQKKSQNIPHQGDASINSINSPRFDLGSSKRSNLGWVGRRSLLKSLWGTILIFIVGVLIVVWPVYLFNTHNYPPARQKADTTNLLQSYGNRTFANPVIWASDKPGLRALSGYGLGLLMVNQRAVGGNTTYFLGEVSRFGWHYYFPIVYFIKEPLAWWGLVLIVLLTISSKVIHIQGRTLYKSYPQRGQIMERSKDWTRAHFAEFAMLLWLLIYWSSSLYSNLNIGVRHLLPTFPFAILLVSGQISRILNGIINYESGIGQKRFKTIIRNSTLIILLFFLLSSYIIENLKTWPYYLTYFNQTVGGPAGGYKYVVDSNLDWGQDLKRFGQWIKKNDIPKIELDYFGWADPSYYLGTAYVWTNSQKYKNAEDFRVRNQTSGWLAVSATFLQGSQGPPDQFKPVNYLWLQAHKPIITIGHSIFVYQIK